MPSWKVIKAPKSLYLPVILGQGFDKSGMQVGPDDKLEVLKGSNQIRINGVDYKMMIAVDTLRTDEKGVIQLSKPAPPARVNSGGAGYASVGGLGKAVRSAAENTFTPEGSRQSSRQSSRRSPGGATSARGFPIVSDETGPYGAPTRPYDDPGFFDDGGGSGPSMDLGEPDPDFDPGCDLTDVFADPTVEKRNITLGDGSQAWAWFDKVSGKQVGTPTRIYQAAFVEGRQVGQRVRSQGPKVEFDEAEYQAALAEQMEHTTLAPTGHDIPRAQPKHAPRTLHGSSPRPIPPGMAEGSFQKRPPLREIHQEEFQQMERQAASHVCAPSGSPHLDNLISASTWGGYPIGKLTWLQGPAPLRRALLIAAGASYTESFTTALGDMALLQVRAKPIIVLEIEDLTSTEARLGLAEDLPTLIEQIAGIKKAAFVISTPTVDTKLLQFMSALVITIETLATDERFTKATLIKNTLCDQQGQATTFPTPQV